MFPRSGSSPDEPLTAISLGKRMAGILRSLPDSYPQRGVAFRMADFIEITFAFQLLSSYFFLRQG